MRSAIPVLVSAIVGVLGAAEPEQVPLRAPLTTLVPVSEPAPELHWSQLAGPASAQLANGPDGWTLYCPEPGDYRFEARARFGSETSVHEVPITAVADDQLAAAHAAGTPLVLDCWQPSAAIEQRALRWQRVARPEAQAGGSVGLELRGGEALRRADVAWIAVAPGAGPGWRAAHTSEAVDQRWSEATAETPAVLLAGMQGMAGGDLAALRHRREADGSWWLRVEEERSRDEETSHVRERIGLLALSAAGPVHDDTGAAVGVAGVVRIPADGRWHPLGTERRWRDPIAVVGPPSSHDAEPVVTRTRVVDGRIEVRLEEWWYQDGAHPAEDLPYLVIEAGRHRIDGLVWAAGRRKAVAQRAERVDFPSAFAAPPLVFTQIEDAGSALPLVTRVPEIAAAGFQVLLQQETLPASNPELAAAVPQLRYRVRFAAAGVYRCWLRARYPQRGLGRCRLRLEQGDRRAEVQLGLRSGDWDWSDRGHPRHHEPVLLAVPAAGEAVLILHEVDPGLELDRLILVADHDWRPEHDDWLDPGRYPRAVVGEALALQAELASERFAARGQRRPLGQRVLVAELSVPATAPADLGVGVYVVDAHGTWFQRARPGPLEPGRQRLELAVDGHAPLLGAPGPAVWDGVRARTATGGGLYLWSATPSAAAITVHELRWDDRPAPQAEAGASLHDLDLGAPLRAGALALRTGERWQLSCLPQPLPADPYDHRAFALSAHITRPDGATDTVAAFWWQPMTISDGGDRDLATPTGSGRFALRYRPRLPGRYRVELRLERDGELAWTRALPPLTVSGPAVDPYVRVDPAHPRFFHVDGDWYWPIGLNVRSVYDLRSQGRLGTALTPDRRVQAYEAYFARLAAAGANAVEIWMAPWNLALEWRADWPGYHGLGWYHQGNAARLDRILAAAWAHGLRVNLVIHNHGQASARTDREWSNNPYNQALGGPAPSARAFFTEPEALAGQERLRRYLVARYADHPAVLGWKLFSEVNLTGGDREELVDWHRHAAARWRALDPYGHPVTTHWSGNYRTPYRPIVALPGIDYVCIDAYHRDDFLADLVWRSTEDPEHGLAAFAKPLLITEFGGTSGGASDAQLGAEHASAGWAALVAGHAGSPMLWWWEWVDQGERWSPYTALSRFIAGEDPRDPAARPLVMQAPAGLWARAWVTPERVLGYCCDEAWGRSGEAAEHAAGTRLELPAGLPPGTWRIEWWHADRGQPLAETTATSDGNRLILEAPAFTNHLAFKAWPAGD